MNFAEATSWNSSEDIHSPLQAYDRAVHHKSQAYDRAVHYKPTIEQEQDWKEIQSLLGE